MQPGPSRAAGLIKSIFAPAALLMGRLRFGLKFVLVGIVLVIPLVVVVLSYLGVQSTNTDFANKEQVGLVYLKPAVSLLDAVTAARSVAVQAASGSTNSQTAAKATVTAAISNLNDAHQMAGTLGLGNHWTGLRSQIDAALASVPGTPSSAFTRYNGLTAGVENLIAADGNNSNMILDPDNDSYYLMDAVLNRLTLLVDLAGQAGDLQATYGGAATPTLAQRLAIEDLKQNILSTISADDSDYDSATTNTKDQTVAPAVRPYLTRLDSALKLVVGNLSAAVNGHLDATGAHRLGVTAEHDAVALEAATLPATQRLVAARIGGYSANSRRTELITLVCVLLGLWLFVGFYLYVRSSVAGILRATTGVAERGDVSVAVESSGRDELADVSRAFEQVIDYLRETATAAEQIADGDLSIEVRSKSTEDQLSNAFSKMVGNLRAIVGDVSETARRLGTASNHLSAASEDSGRSVSEIATAVDQVARGAEDQARQAELVKSYADQTLEAARQSSTKALDAASSVREASEVARAGVSAAREATAAMDSVGEASAEIKVAITGLAERSTEIGSIIETISQIANQTTLLALNAAIEAAQAGEHGRGFAVVAGEVGRLAEASQAAATHIAGLIQETQEETNRVVRTVDEGNTRTLAGAEIVARAGTSFVQIGDAVQAVDSQIQEITETAEQIAAECERIQQGIEEIAAVAEQSSASTQQVSASTSESSETSRAVATSAVELAETARTLQNLISQFRLTAGQLPDTNGSVSVPDTTAVEPPRTLIRA